MLARGLRTRRRQPIGSGTLADRTSTADPVDTIALPHTDASALRIELHSGANGSGSRSTPHSKEHGSADGLPSNENIAIFSPLLGIQWLDQLILDAARPAAPDSLKDDAQSVLAWLGVDTLAALKIEHYDRFTQAFQRYLLECQASSVGNVQATSCSSLALTDDIRGAFSRLLEREQTAKIFEQALELFAKVWIRIFIVLNVIAIIGLIATAPSLSIGVVRFSEAYNPFNVWSLAVQVVGLSPALVAIAWLHRRLRSVKVTAPMGFANSVAGSPIGRDVGSQTPRLKPG